MRGRSATSCGSAWPRWAGLRTGTAACDTAGIRPPLGQLWTLLGRVAPPTSRPTLPPLVCTAACANALPCAAACRPPPSWTPSCRWRGSTASRWLLCSRRSRNCRQRWRGRRRAPRSRGHAQLSRHSRWGAVVFPACCAAACRASAGMLIAGLASTRICCAARPACTRLCPTVPALVSPTADWTCLMFGVPVPP